jgi:hypothetical protein
LSRARHKRIQKRRKSARRFSAFLERVIDAMPPAIAPAIWRTEEQIAAQFELWRKKPSPRPLESPPSHEDRPDGAD